MLQDLIAASGCKIKPDLEFNPKSGCNQINAVEYGLAVLNRLTQIQNGFILPLLFPHSPVQ